MRRFNQIQVELQGVQVGLWRNIDRLLLMLLILADDIFRQPVHKGEGPRNSFFARADVVKKLIFLLNKMLGHGD